MIPTPLHSVAARFTLWASGLALAAGSALAQSWPTKPVTLVVPWPAGGPSDFVARQIQNDTAKTLGQTLGRTLIVENVGGVGGALGVQKVLASSDGHTLLLGSPLELIIPPLTLASVKYKSNDLRMVAQLVRAPMVLLARKELAADNVDELIALAKRNPKPLAMAKTGPGSLFHLMGERFAQLLGTEFVQVPYRGSTPALGDLMGGQVDLMFTIFAGPVPAMIADGKVKVLGLAVDTPLAKFPKIAAQAAHPRLAEFKFDSWADLQVPRNTPEEVAARLNKAAYEAMQNPQVRQAFEAAGNLVVSATSPADLDRIYQAEIVRYQTIARSINLLPQQ